MIVKKRRLLPFGLENFELPRERSRMYFWYNEDQWNVYREKVLFDNDGENLGKRGQEVKIVRRQVRKPKRREWSGRRKKRRKKRKTEHQEYCCVKGCLNEPGNRRKESLKREYCFKEGEKICNRHYFSDLYFYKKEKCINKFLMKQKI